MLRYIPRVTEDGTLYDVFDDGPGGDPILVGLVTDQLARLLIAIRDETLLARNAPVASQEAADDPEGAPLPDAPHRRISVRMDAPGGLPPGYRAEQQKEQS